MVENVVIVNCQVSSEAYQLLSMLRQKPSAKGCKVTHAALVKKKAGELSLVDSFVTEDEESGCWTGGLIGGLVGLMAGPVGALAGYAAGKLIGNAADERKLEDVATLLEKAGESLNDGDTAVLLLAQSYLFIWYNSLLSRLLPLSVVKSTQVWIFLMLLWYHRDDNSFLWGMVDCFKETQFYHKPVRSCFVLS